MRRLLPAHPILLAALLLLAGCQSTKPTENAPSLQPTVVLVSIDGFRADYLDRYEAPVLARLAAEGVRAERLIPSFPTKTFPNHYTLVTGLYPEHHGIVANTMYDPDFDASFSLGNRDAVADARWWGGEPLWVTAEKQGQRAGIYFWPGSEAAIGGVRPSYWKVFDEDVPGSARVDELLGWLDRPPEERPTFLTLYFSDVDHAGHDFGPDAPQVAEAIRTVDGYLGRLVEGLKARRLYDQVNLIVVSDHGMAGTSADRVIFLDDYLDLEDVRVVDWNPVVMLRPEAGRADAVVEALRTVPHLTVYRREEVPERLHYQAHVRIPPVIGLADEGWVITSKDYFERRPTRFDGGTHGYDPELPSMGALFVARGPALARGQVVGPFANIHVYNLMAAMLGLRPAPNDGDLDAVRHVLSPAPAAP